MVVRKIGADILGGRYTEGAVLPNEAAIAVEYGVSRTSVREAVKVLSAKGLIEARPRTGLRVRPRDEWNMLDPAVFSWHPDPGADADLLAGLLETRRIIEPAAAALAALRGTAADLAAMEAALNGMSAAIPHNLEACCEADLDFHSALIMATHNIVLRGLIGTIRAALISTFAVTNKLMATQSNGLESHRKVLEHIRMRDTAGARTAMAALLDVSTTDLHRVSRLDSQGSAPGS